MRLTRKAIEALNRETILRLCLALNFTETWLNKLVVANKDNGPLTTTKALDVIREATNLTDAQILEETEKIPS